MIHCPEKYQQKAGNSKDHKEGIILFKEARLHLVMIFMQPPQKTMHDKPVGTPGYSFHQQKSAEQNQYIIQYDHLSFN
jgi:hypothetical protein